MPPAPLASTEDAPAPATVIVLFGATGDLAQRMVIPALFDLHRLGLVPELTLIGNGRGAVSDDEFRDEARAACEKAADGDLDDEAWARFAPQLRFAGHGFTEDDAGELPDVLAAATRAMGGSPQRLLYLSLPPERFEPVTRAIGAHGLAAGSRVVFEKPYGTSCSSFTSLDRVVHEVFDEQQVFRIDHFLGKEATSDLHVVRFANGLFARSWDREHIDSVQIDIPETLDVANRGAFYDRTGAVLDMIVTHLVQLVAEVAMDPPRSLDPDDVAAARNEILRHLCPVDPADVVLGQYEGYAATDGVEDGSTTDTYAALRLELDTDRWRGVPFVLRTGKALARSAQQVTVVFRPPPQTCGFDDGVDALTFSLAGQGAVGLRLLAHRPSAGSSSALAPASIDLPLTDLVAPDPLPAYVGLIFDALHDDHARYTRPDGLADVWDAFAPLLDDPPGPIPYPVGSWGPPEADRLVRPLGWFAAEADA